MLGVSSKKIGILANENNLKIDEFGSWFNDKAKKHNKEVQTFRYYENVIGIFEKLVNKSA